MSDGATIASHFEDAEQQREAGLMGMWLFLATELLLFAGLFGGFAIYRGLHGDAFAAAARHLDLPLATANTVILLTSGLSMALAERMAHAGVGDIHIQNVQLFHCRLTPALLNKSVHAANNGRNATRPSWVTRSPGAACGRARGRR